jgi:hypothetical protein
MMRCVPASSILVLLVLACACGAAEPEKQREVRGGELMVCCCFGDYTVAERHARRIKEVVPGAVVRIAARKTEDDSERMVFEVYASHPDLKPEELGAKLAEFSCPNARGD